MTEWLNNIDGKWVGPFLTAFLTVLAMTLLRNALRGSNDHEPTESGVIKVSRVVMWSCIVGGFLFSVLFASLTIFSTDDPTVAVIGPIGAVAFLAIPVFGFIALSPHYNLVWDSYGVEGSAKEFSIKWRADRNRLAWSEIVEVETKNNGVVVMRSAGLEKIYYSQFHTNHGKFEATLKHKRPDLFA